MTKRLLIVMVVAGCGTEPRAAQKPQPAPLATNPQYWCYAITGDSHSSGCTKSRQLCDENAAKMQRGDPARAVSRCEPKNEAVCFALADQNGDVISKCFASMGHCRSLIDFMVLHETGMFIKSACAYEPQAAAPLHEWSWWCASDGDRQFVCSRDQADCNSSRGRMNTGGSSLGQCAGAEMAACFMMREALSSGMQMTCAPDVRACKFQRDYVISERRDDYQVLTECVPTG